MMGIAVLIELANVVTLQCSHDADPREHRRPVGLRDQVRHRTGAYKSQKPLILLAIPAGLEPATRGVEIRYSIQLSYGIGWRPDRFNPS